MYLYICMVIVSMHLFAKYTIFDVYELVWTVENYKKNTTNTGR